MNRSLLSITHCVMRGTTPGYLRQPPGFSMVSHVRLCLAVFAILVIQWEEVDVPTSSDDF